MKGSSRTKPPGSFDSSEKYVDRIISSVLLAFLPFSCSSCPVPLGLLTDYLPAGKKDSPSRAFFRESLAVPGIQSKFLSIYGRSLC